MGDIKLYEIRLFVILKGVLEGFTGSGLAGKIIGSYFVDRFNETCVVILLLLLLLLLLLDCFQSLVIIYV